MVQSQAVDEFKHDVFEIRDLRHHLAAILKSPEKLWAQAMFIKAVCRGFVIYAMRVRSAIKKLCDACRIVKRRGRVFVVCKSTPKVRCSQFSIVSSRRPCTSTNTDDNFRDSLSIACSTSSGKDTTQMQLPARHPFPSQCLLSGDMWHVCLKVPDHHHPRALCNCSRCSWHLPRMTQTVTCRDAMSQTAVIGMQMWARGRSP